MQHQIHLSTFLQLKQEFRFLISFIRSSSFIFFSVSSIAGRVFTSSNLHEHPSSVDLSAIYCEFIVFSRLHYSNTYQVTFNIYPLVSCSNGKRENKQVFSKMFSQKHLNLSPKVGINKQSVLNTLCRAGNVNNNTCKLFAASYTT